MSGALPKEEPKEKPKEEPKEEGPLILVLAKFVLRLIGYVCVSYTLVLWAWISLISTLSNFVKKQNPIIYLLLFIPRCILALSVISVGLFLFVFPAEIAKKQFEDSTIVALLSYFVVGLTMVHAFLRKSDFPVAHSILSAKHLTEYVNVLKEVAKDLLFTLYFLVSLPLRFPAYLCALPFGKHEKTWRKEIEANVAFTIVDLFALPCFALVLPCFWRSASIFRSVNSLSDILWNMKLRDCVFAQFKNAISDVVHFLLATLVACSIYRISPMLARDQPDATFWTRRKRIVRQQFSLLIFDIIVTVPLLSVIVTGYRIPSLKRQLNLNNAQVNFREPYFHWCVLSQFGNLVIDAFYAIFGAIVIGLVWRAIPLLYDLYKASSAQERRRLSLHHFGMLFVDILDIPILVLSLIISVTLWRAIPMWTSLKQAQNRSQRRKAVLQHFQFWLLDILCFVLALVVFGTFIRAKKLYRALVTLSKQPEPVRVPREGIDADEDPTPIITKTWHEVVFREFLQLILDIPLYLLSLTTLWRFPFLVRRMINECTTDEERRALIGRYIILTLKDIPAFVCLAIMTLSLWRIPFLFIAFKRYQRGDDEHQIVKKEFTEWVKDIPFVACSLLPLACPWRILGFISDLVQCEEQSKRRRMCVTYAGLVILDFIHIFCVLLIFGTVVRIWSWISYLRAKKQVDAMYLKFPKTGTFYRATEFAMGDLWFDFVTLLEIAVIWVVVAKIPKFLKEAYRVTVDAYLGKANPDLDVRKRYVGHAWQVDANLGIHFYVYVAEKSAVESMKLIPHILMIPFKILALPLVGVYYFSLWKYPQIPIEKRNNVWYYSDIMPNIWGLQKISKESMTFKKMHVFFFSNIGILILSISQELIVLFSMINIFFMSAITFASPLWAPHLKKLPRQMRRGIKVFMNATQLIWAPIVGLYIVFIQIFPLFVILAYAYPLHTLYAHHYLHLLDSKVVLFVEFLSAMTGNMSLGASSLFSTLSQLYQSLMSLLFQLEKYKILYLHFKFWSLAGYLTYGLASKFPYYILKFLHYKYVTYIWTFVLSTQIWMSIMTLGLKMSYRFAVKYIELFAPVEAIKWWVEGIIAGRMWRQYRILLAAPTAWCFKHRKTLFIGEILMFPLFAAWAGLPLIVPILLGKSYLFLLSVPASLLLAFSATDIVSSSWKDIKAAQEQKPVLTVEKVNVRFEKYGMALILQCSKPSTFVIQQSRLHLLGDQLWKGLSKIAGSTTIATFRYTFHPIVLCDTYFDHSVFKTGSPKVTIPLQFGTASQGWLKVNTQYVLKPRLQDLVSKYNNPTVQILIEHGTKKTFGWNSNGVLVNIKFTISDLLNSAESGIQLKCD